MMIRQAYLLALSLCCVSWLQGEEFEEISPDFAVYMPAVFEHEIPYFELSTTHPKPGKIRWQISSHPDFTIVHPALEGIQNFADRITLPVRADALLQNEQEYYCRFRSHKNEGWSEWSEIFPFTTFQAELNQKVYDRVAPFLLPDNNPLKASLDRIFSSSRVLFNLKSLRAAGFITSGSRKFTKIIVATHPDFPQYIFKLFLDAQRYEKDIPQYEYWVNRCEGAQLIQQVIDNRGFQNVFKVPRKWIYIVPPGPSVSSDFVPKDFLLVQDRMDIYPDPVNEKMWKSDTVTQDLLRDYFILIRDVGYSDIKPANNPFCKDGKVAFVDTQAFHREVPYKYYLQFLSSANKDYWNQLIQNPPP